MLVQQSRPTKERPRSKEVVKSEGYILFLDDDPNRAALAYQRFKPGDRERTIWCSTVEEAIITLKDYEDKLKAVWLDHDLGGKTYVHTASEECGMEIVRYLERLARKDKLNNLKNVYFRIHSWNIEAGNKMHKRLKAIGLDVEYIPFGL